MVAAPASPAGPGSTSGCPGWSPAALAATDPRLADRPRRCPAGPDRVLAAASTGRPSPSTTTCAHRAGSPGRPGPAQRAARCRAPGVARGAAAHEHRAAAVPGPDRGRRRRRAPQARAQPPRRRPAAPRGPRGEDPPGPRCGGGRSGRCRRHARRGEDRRPGRRSRSCGRWPTASSRRCWCRAGCPRRCGPPGRARRCPRRSRPKASAATTRTSRRRSTSAAWRRCRTPAKHAGDGASAQGPGLGRGRHACPSRSSTTVAASTSPRWASTGTGSSTWVTGSAPSTATSRSGRRLAGAPGSRPVPSPLIGAVVDRRQSTAAKRGSPPASQRRRTARGLSSSLLT